MARSVLNAPDGGAPLGEAHPDDYARAFGQALEDTDFRKAHEVVESATMAGLPAERVLFELVLPAVERMMRSASEGCEVSLAQHFLSSQIASDLAGWLIPRFKTVRGDLGRVVVGTSAGDFHGLGKTIVSGCLRAHNIHVIDLGLNVAPEVFVDRAVLVGASVIGISSMMVHTATGPRGCRGVRAILRERGLEGRIKIVVGGAPYRHNAQLYNAVEADAWAEDGLAAASVVRRVLGEVQA